MREHRFFADGYVSREKYASAVVLEKHLQEINNPNATRWVKKVLGAYCDVMKGLRYLELTRYKEFIGKMVRDHFLGFIKKADKPEKVKTLLANIIITKFRIEILEVDKNANRYGALGVLSKMEARLEKLYDEVKIDGVVALRAKNGYRFGDEGKLTIDEKEMEVLVSFLKNCDTLQGIGMLRSYLK